MKPDYDNMSLNTYANSRKPKILFLKPDINDKDPDDPLLYMAKVAKKLDNDVEILTSNCKKKFIDKELKNITVHQIGKFIPKQIFGWGSMFMYFIRIFCLLIWLIAMKRYLKPSLIVTHNSIALLPFLKLIGYFHIVQIYTFDETELLAAVSQGIIKTRNIICNVCMSFADKIIVHDKLSRTVFMKVFSLENNNPIILYPCMTESSFEESPIISIQNIINVHNDAHLLVCFGPMRNNSNFELCVEAFSLLMEESRTEVPCLYFNTYLIIASQYDSTKEYTEYYQKLKHFTHIYCNKKTSVIFLNEVPSSYRKTLMSKCAAILLPMVCFNSHTILQAGLMKKPVIATNGGIAAEFIQNGLNGFLVTPIPTEFAKCMASVLYSRYVDDASLSYKIFVYAQRKFGLNQYFCKFRHVVAQK